MKPKENWEDYTLENAVRDICSVSVAPAAKSEIKRILAKLLRTEKERTTKKLDEYAEQNPHPLASVIVAEIVELLKDD